MQKNQNENATLKISSTPLCHEVVSPRGFLAFFLGKYLLRHFWALENLIADIKEFHDNFKLGLALTLNCIFQPIRIIDNQITITLPYQGLYADFFWCDSK